MKTILKVGSNNSVQEVGSPHFPLKKVGSNNPVINSVNSVIPITRLTRFIEPTYPCLPGKPYLRNVFFFSVQGFFLSVPAKTSFFRFPKKTSFFRFVGQASFFFGSPVRRLFFSSFPEHGNHPNSLNFPHMGVELTSVVE